MSISAFSFGDCIKGTHTDAGNLHTTRCKHMQYDLALNHAKRCCCSPGWADLQLRQYAGPQLLCMPVCRQARVSAALALPVQVNVPVVAAAHGLTACWPWLCCQPALLADAHPWMRR